MDMTTGSTLKIDGRHLGDSALIFLFSFYILLDFTVLKKKKKNLNFRKLM